MPVGRHTFFTREEGVTMVNVPVRIDHQQFCADLDQVDTPRSLK